LYTLKYCVEEPIVVNTVSNRTVSAEKLSFKAELSEKSSRTHAEWHKAKTDATAKRQAVGNFAITNVYFNIQRLQCNKFTKAVEGIKTKTKFDSCGWLNNGLKINTYKDGKELVCLPITNGYPHGM
jgi:hypothetical protein